jgi:hypothetical protein
MFIWPKPGTLGACFGENGPKTARTATEFGLKRDRILIRVRPSYGRTCTVPLARQVLNLTIVALSDCWPIAADIVAGNYFEDF